MSLRFAAYALVPVGLITATAASAQTTTTTTTTIETRREPLRLSPAQRTVIRRVIRRDNVVQAVPSATVRVGDVVPPAVVLAPVPETVYAEIPEVQPYRYYYVNNQLVLVDPRTSQVVDIIGD